MTSFLAIKKIHMVGIGGSGMSGIAEILHNLGFQVTGSDVLESEVIEHLKLLGIKVKIGHSIQNVGGAEVVVHSSAIHASNPELQEAQKQHIPIIHRGEMLAELMKLKTSIAVCGTHGKTTTTSILANCFHELGLDPTVVIGGRLKVFEGSSKCGNGKLFIAEADESDGSFLKLSPTIAVVTNIDKDHLDFYGSLEKIIESFEKFLSQIPFYGAVCACLDDPNVEMILPQIKRKVITFGASRDADISAKNIAYDGFYSSYTPVVFGQEYKNVRLKMPGFYNVSNSLACFAIAHLFQIDPNKTAECISHFQGVEHRFSFVGEKHSTVIIDDYAHNPKKIQTVLAGAKQNFPDRYCIAVFQPHRYSRLKLQWDEFCRSFANADEVIITPIYTAGEQPQEGVSQERLVDSIQLGSFKEGKQRVFLAKNLDEVVLECRSRISKFHSKKCLIITLGAGDIKYVGKRILKEL